jgi:CheY-like chemotaxis protein
MKFGFPNLPLLREGQRRMRDQERLLDTILLVDDDVDVLDSMSECLQGFGYPTLQAQNGQIALNLLKKTAPAPSLILLDMSMPVLDGRGFLERRVKDSVLLRIPVVVISGNDAPASPLTKVNAYLRKPVSMELLMSVIQSAL